jgi:hypothetical protein
MIELLYDALATPLGLIVKTDNPGKLRDHLDRLRKKDAEFADLSFCVSPLNPKTEIWIIKRVDNEKE